MHRDFCPDAILFLFYSLRETEWWRIFSIYSVLSTTCFARESKSRTSMVLGQGRIWLPLRVSQHRPVRFSCSAQKNIPPDWVVLFWLACLICAFEYINHTIFIVKMICHRFVIVILVLYWYITLRRLAPAENYYVVFFIIQIQISVNRKNHIFKSYCNHFKKLLLQYKIILIPTENWYNLIIPIKIL